jgi:hypothetical protein
MPLVIVVDGRIYRTALRRCCKPPVDHGSQRPKPRKGWSLCAARRGAGRAADASAISTLDATAALPGRTFHCAAGLPARKPRHRDRCAPAPPRQDAALALLGEPGREFWISLASGYPIADTQSGFRVYPARLLQTANVRADRSRSFVFESEILIEAARRGVVAACVPISVVYSERGRASYFRPVVDIARIVRMVAWRLLPRRHVACAH